MRHTITHSFSRSFNHLVTYVSIHVVMSVMRRKWATSISFVTLVERYSNLILLAYFLHLLNASNSLMSKLLVGWVRLWDSTCEDQRLAGACMVTVANRLLSTVFSAGWIKLIFMFNANELNVRTSRSSCASLRKEENTSSVDVLVSIGFDIFGRTEAGYFSNI